MASQGNRWSMAGKRQGGVVANGKESEDISQDKGEESANKSRIGSEGGAGITNAGFKHVEDRKRD